MIYNFDDHALDSDRRELRRGGAIVDIEPQVFDLLEYLIDNRERVVSKDDLLAAIWNGRVVSESTLSSRIAALRRAVGDTGERQAVIRTVARKGFRFVGNVHATGATRTAADVPAAPRAPDIHEAPNRRQLTVMACRITSGTVDSSPPDPEELRDAHAESRRAVGAAVAPHGGRIGANAGDAILVHFGYPGAHEDDAERAVRAGLAVISAMQSRAHAAPVQAHIGIATGLVVVDEPHRNGGLEVSGPPLHQALRLMEAAGAGQLAIADGTRKLVGKLFECRALDRANGAATTDAGTNGAGINGAGHADAAWQVMRETAIANRFEALRARNAPLIGRDEELAMLRRRWEHAQTGDGRVVLIWGEAGIGKSRLVAALCDALRGEPHVCLRYDCSPHRMQTALHPIVAQLEDAAGFAATDSADLKLDKLAGVLDRSSADNAQDLALFADLLSIPGGTRLPALALSAQRRKELLLERFIAQVAGLASRTAVLMILEDAHWIDPTTRELFDAVIERVRGLRVLLIMTYRPEFSPSWLGQSHVTALTLNRLGPRENAALVRHIAGGKALPPTVLAQIMTRSDGVPLFSEEVTKSVLESGIVREAAGEYVLAEPLQAPAVPATLQASLFARIDRLAHLRPLVQTSAALGREFGYRLLRAACGLSDAELEPLLDELVGSGLVHQRGAPPHATYAFKHALVQDAAYETMLKGQRIETHRRIVEVLRLEFPEFAERQPDVLAHHCTEANLWEEAIGFSIAAARTALERSAGIEAQSHVQRALALLPRVPTSEKRMLLEGRLRVALADALIMTQGFASPGVMTALTRARELLREHDDPEVSLRALCGLFNFHLIRSESPACLALAAPMLECRHERPVASVIHFLAGTANLHLGNFRETIHHLETALSLYDEKACRSVAFVNGYHLRSFTLIWLSLGYLYVGEFEQAADTMRAAVADARSRSHPFTLVSALLAQARFLGHRHDLAGAVAATEEGWAVAAEQRSPYHLSRAGILRAVNALDGGDAAQAIELMEQALIAHRATGANFQSSYNLSRLAEAYARAGQHARALQLADDAVAEVERTGERWWEAEAERVRGEILLLADPSRLAAAEQGFSKALACAGRQQARLWEINAKRSLAVLWQAHGRRAAAKKLLATIPANLTPSTHRR